MPLVFVHGVNVREGPMYERERTFRDQNFAEIFYRELGRQVEPDSIFKIPARRFRWTVLSCRVAAKNCSD